MQEENEQISASSGVKENEKTSSGVKENENTEKYPGLTLRVTLD